MNGFGANPLRSTLRNDANGGIILDTKEPGLAKLRVELAMRTLSPECTSPVTVPTRSDPSSPRGHLHATGVPRPPPTAVHPPKSLRFVPAEAPQTTATRLWCAHPSKLPATVASTYRPPPTTTAQDHFEYLRDERESLDTTHFMKKNQLTEYLRVAIRTKVNLKATGH